MQYSFTVTIEDGQFQKTFEALKDVIRPFVKSDSQIGQLTPAHHLAEEILTPASIGESDGTLVIYIDSVLDMGKASKSGYATEGFGVYGYLCKDGPANPLYCVGNEYGTTLARLNVLALYKALVNCPVDSKVIVYSTSEYIVKSFNKWLGGWVKNGFVGVNGPIKNQDLWSDIATIKAILDVTVVEADAKTDESFSLIRSACLTHLYTLTKGEEELVL